MIKNLIIRKAEEHFVDHTLEDYGDVLITYSKSPVFLLEDGDEYVLYSLYGSEENINRIIRVSHSYGA